MRLQRGMSSIFPLLSPASITKKREESSPISDSLQFHSSELSCFILPSNWIPPWAEPQDWLRIKRREYNAFGPAMKEGFGVERSSLWKGGLVFLRDLVTVTVQFSLWDTYNGILLLMDGEGIQASGHTKTKRRLTKQADQTVHIILRDGRHRREEKTSNI